MTIHEPMTREIHKGSESSDTHTSDQERKMYWRFAAMIATSVAVMFALTYLNSYELAHVRWSETRFFMMFVMGSAMAVIMLSFMLSMYTNKALNAAIVIGSLVVFAAGLFFVRSQETVQDQSWMSGMIPHHSIAILTSENAEISDIRVRELADAIIEAQEREIAEMEWLIADIEANGEATTQAEAEARPVPDLSE